MVMSAHSFPTIHPLGDSAFLVQFDFSVIPIANQQALQCHAWLTAHRPAGILESIPAYTTLLLTYNPLLLSALEVENWLNETIKDVPTQLPVSSRLIEVPIVYGGEAGPDLIALAEAHHLSPEDVIQRHLQADYLVAMMGFAPGFVYLSGLDQSLATPRLATPRTLVPAGSVGIAGEQTGIYSIESPGGWQLIGRTSLKLFDPQSETPFLFEPGDQIKFVPMISLEEHNHA